MASAQQAPRASLLRSEYGRGFPFALSCAVPQAETLCCALCCAACCAVPHVETGAMAAWSGARVVTGRGGSGQAECEQMVDAFEDQVPRPA